MIAEREVALRLAADKDIDRKLRVTSGSRFFWVYSLSLWDPDAFWKCISGASAFAMVGIALESFLPGQAGSAPLTATVSFEYFLLGLLLMWLYSLGPWLNPTNLSVIFVFLFGLYRKRRTVDDLSAGEIRRLFPEEEDVASHRGTLWWLWAIYLQLKRSPVTGSLIVGAVLASLVLAPLLLLR